MNTHRISPSLASDANQPIFHYNKPKYEPDDPRVKDPWFSEQMRALLVWGKAKNINVKLPETNSFGRPTSDKRQQRLKQLHFTKLRNLCPAPLPQDLYERLEQYVRGTAKPIPPKRTFKPSGEVELLPGERVRELTTRSIRRHYQKVFEESPLLHINPDTQKWEVKPKDPLPYPDASKEEIEGVNEEIITPKKGRR